MEWPRFLSFLHSGPIRRLGRQQGGLAKCWGVPHPIPSPGPVPRACTLARSSAPNGRGAASAPHRLKLDQKENGSCKRS